MIQASAVCQPFYCVLSVIWQHGSHAVTQFLVFAIVLLWLKWARGLLIFLFSECLSAHLLKNGPTTFQQLSPCQISASVPKAQLCILLRSLCWSSHCGPCIDCIETRSLFKWERPGTRGARGTLHNKTRSFALLNLLNLLATHGDVMHIISLHSYMAKSIKIPWLMSMFPIQRAQKCRGILPRSLRNFCWVDGEGGTTYKPHPDGVLRSKQAQCGGFLK